MLIHVILISQRQVKARNYIIDITIYMYVYVYVYMYVYAHVYVYVKILYHRLHDYPYRYAAVSMW